MVVKLRSAKWLAIVALAACEVIADFDRTKLDQKHTIGPTPLPTVDGAVALMPDAAEPDGALIGPSDDLDAALADDAGSAADATIVTDSAGLDASPEAQVGPELPDASDEVAPSN